MSRTKPAPRPVGTRSMTFTKYTGDTIAGDVQLEIDWDALWAFMGRRALYSKCGVTNMQEGMIRARATNVRTEPKQEAPDGTAAQ